MSMSQSPSFMARMLSVVHAIQPEPGSSASAGSSWSSSWPPRFAAACSSRYEISCTPTAKSGRRRWTGADGSITSQTDRGILERTEIL